MLLINLGTLNPVYFLVRSQIMGSSIMSSLSETTFWRMSFLRCHLTTTAVSDWSALTAQGRRPSDEATLVDTEVVLT